MATDAPNAGNALTFESDFSYEPPDNAPDGDLNKEARSAIDDIVAEFDSPQDDGLGYEDDGGGEGDPSEDAGLGEGTEAPTSETSTEPGEEPDDPKLARGIERVVARELAAKERESAATQAEARAQGRIDELRALQKEAGGIKAAKDLAEQLEFDPVGVFRSLGKDPSAVIRLAMAQELGDEAPDSLKQLSANSAQTRRIKALESKLEQQEKAQAATQYFTTKSNEAREWLKKTVDTNPALKADVDYLHAEVMDEIIRDSNARAAAEPDGEPISPEAAYAKVEARGRRLAALYGAVKQDGKQVGTQTGKKPNAVPPITKPATKPISPGAPWLKKTTDLEAEGLREAMREYNRVEAERKARR